MNLPPVVSPQEWEAAREQLLVKEKELTRARDALAAERRRMPRQAVSKDYSFDGPDGPVGLLDLFEGRRQLIVYRFFFEPGVSGWPEGGCRGCSFGADQVGHFAHLNARDTTFAYVSRAPQEDIARYRDRMGWEVPWYTLTDDFDSDFGVDEWHGTNAFIRDGDEIFRTYFVNSRGDEALGSTWSYLDITALGRQEIWEDSPEDYPQTQAYAWWNRHDEYDEPTVFQAALDAQAASQRGEREHLMATAEAIYIERTYDAPAEAVFDAWTDERVLRRWFHAQRDWSTSEASVDLRVDGAVRVVMHDPVKGEDHGGGGHYTEVDRPTRLAFTWTWDREDRETLIEIDFEASANGRTTVRFTHSNLRDLESARDHEEGWGNCFDNLERALAGANA